MTGAALVVGATSGAGKSTVVAALCRALARRELRVAPFKAQNMSNHAAVTVDGGEIGRAQATQAGAALVAPERRMNPILLKPAGDRGCHVVVLGEERHVVDPSGSGMDVRELGSVVLGALASLRAEYPWVIAEGAGGAAEINLLERDLVNLPLARAAGLPAILVVDIERGGAFAAAHGTIDLVPPELRRTVKGIVLNRFRGDPSLLDSGIVELEARTGVPVLGVLPWLGPGPLLGVEDSLDVAGWGGGGERSTRPVRVAAVRLPHLANPSDLDAFLVEPDVVVRWVTGPGQLADSDLVVVPGSRATVADLGWLRSRGVADAIADLSGTTGSAGAPRVVGICGGYQMLGRSIDDPVESGVGPVEGLGLLGSVTRFRRPKIVRCSQGRAGPHRVGGYQIRFGRPEVDGEAWLELDGEPEGARSPSGAVLGTSLHGLFDADGFRQALLAEVAEAGGRRYRAGPTALTAAVEAQHDWVEGHLDLDHLLDLASTAAPAGRMPGW